MYGQYRARAESETRTLNFIGDLFHDLNQYAAWFFLAGIVLGGIAALIYRVAGISGLLWMFLAPIRLALLVTPLVIGGILLNDMFSLEQGEQINESRTVILVTIAAMAIYFRREIFDGGVRLVYFKGMYLDQARAQRRLGTSWSRQAFANSDQGTRLKHRRRNAGGDSFQRAVGDDRWYDPLADVNVPKS